ncbi:MAG TPA: hypothetical protein VLB49_11830 [Gemmatimonadales bacterium]|nr:hypothetical protein [Gemmatimonadales bacterium]
MRQRRVQSGSLLVVAALLVAACSDNAGLGNANIPNVVDTISLYALDRTPIALPSGFVIKGNSVVRTDLVGGFDFAFNITAAGQPVLLPTGALDLGVASGVQVQGASFEALTLAPTSRYVDSLPVPIDSGTVAVVRSRPVSDFCGVVYYYGKVEVLAIDPTARRVDLQILTDQNCGFRGLEPGLPRR